MHPYEMAATMREQHYDSAVRLNYGSLYSVVEALHSAGCIDIEGTERSGNRPERTIYRITGVGRVEMADWVGSILGIPVREYPAFVAGLAFMVVLPPKQVAELLSKRAERLAEELMAMRAELSAVSQGDHRVEPVFLVENEYQLYMCESELRWVQGMVHEIERGGLDGLAGWRQLHESLGH